MFSVIIAHCKNLESWRIFSLLNESIPYYIIGDNSLYLFNLFNYDYKKINGKIFESLYHSNDRTLNLNYSERILRFFKSLDNLKMVKD